MATACSLERPSQLAIPPGEWSVFRTNTPLCYVLSEIRDSLDLVVNSECSNDFSEIDSHRLPPCDHCDRLVVDCPLQGVDPIIRGYHSSCELRVALGKRFNGILT